MTGEVQTFTFQKLKVSHLQGQMFLKSSLDFTQGSSTSNAYVDDGIIFCASFVLTFVKHVQELVETSPFHLSPLVRIGDSSNVLHDVLAGFSLSCSTFP